MIAVFLKEIRILLRSRKAFWMLLATLTLVGGALGLQWLEFVSDDSGIKNRASLGRLFFLSVAVIQMIVMSLSAALMSATAITAERESGTLELLLATGLPRARLLLGKWAAAVFFQLLVTACLLPVMALVFQLGGVGTDEFCFVTAMTALAVLTYAMLGLAASCKRRKSTSAIVFTMLMLTLLVLLLPWGLALLFVFAMGMDDPSKMDQTFAFANLTKVIFIASSPLTTWLYHRDLISPASPGVMILTPAFIGHACFQGMIILLALRSARRGLGRVEQAADDPLPAAMAPAGDLPADWPVPPRTTRPQPREITDRQDPVQVKEFNDWMEGRTSSLTAMITLCILISLPLTYVALKGDPRFVVQALGGTITTILMLAIPLFTAPTIAREREEKTFELLRAAPLSAWRLVQAKFRAVRMMAMLLCLALAAAPIGTRMLGLGAIVLAGQSLPPEWGEDGVLPNLLGPTLLLALPVFAFASLYGAMGIYCSSRQRRSLPALLQTYLLIGLLLFLTLLAIPGIEMLGQSLGFRHPADWLAGILASLINHFMYFTHDFPQPARTLHVTGHRSFIETALWMAAHAAVVLGLASLLLRAAARRVAREGR